MVASKAVTTSILPTTPVVTTAIGVGKHHQVATSTEAATQQEATHTKRDNQTSKDSLVGHINQSQKIRPIPNHFNLKNEVYS